MGSTPPPRSIVSHPLHGQATASMILFVERICVTVARAALATVTIPVIVPVAALPMVAIAALISALLIVAVTTIAVPDRNNRTASRQSGAYRKDKQGIHAVRGPRRFHCMRASLRSSRNTPKHRRPSDTVLRSSTDRARLCGIVHTVKSRNRNAFGFRTKHDERRAGAGSVPHFR